MKKITLVFALLITFSVFLKAQTQRMVLYEGFSNVGCGPCASQNPTNNALIENNPTKVAAIKYQTSGPGSDVMHIQASQWISPRVTYYNITAVPSTRIDGSSSTFNQTNINNRYAVPSPFYLEVIHEFNSACDTVTVKCIVKAAQDFTGSSMVLQVGMIEKHINFATAPGTNGETSFRNIMRRMLPNSNGTSLKNTWTDGETDTITLISPVPTYIYDLNELCFIAFIQSNTDKTIHQAGKNEPIPLDIYMKITSHNIPKLPLCNKEHIIQLKVKNQGNIPITQFDIEYGVTGETPLTETWTGVLNQGQEVTIDLPVLTFVSNTPEMFVKINNPNGATEYPSVHSSISEQVKVISEYTTLPEEENFTATAFPPTNWVSVSYDNAAFWQRSNVGGFGQTPGGSAMLNFYNSPNGQIDYLYVKGLDFTGMISAEISFSVAYARYNASYSDRLRVQVSTNCGSSWATVFDKSGTSLATAPDFSTGQFSPNASQWRKEIISLDNYIGQDEVLVRFLGLSGYGNNLYIDDIVLGPSTSGIENNKLNHGVFIYPNPTDNFIYIELNTPATDDVSIFIYDNMGKIVKSELVNTSVINNEYILDISKYSAGLYYVVLTSNHFVSTHKIIKQ